MTAVMSDYQGHTQHLAELQGPAELFDEKARLELPCHGITAQQNPAWASVAIPAESARVRTAIAHTAAAASATTGTRPTCVRQ